MAPDSIISVKNLKKTFSVSQKEDGFAGMIRAMVNPKKKIVTAVDDISFEIEEGEMVAFLGPNGAGKTTTLKMLSSILYPTSGDILVSGFTPHERKSEFQRQLSLVMGQKNQLWWDLPAKDTFLLHKDIYNIPRTQFETTLRELTELLEVSEILDTQVRKLSLGQRMKCELIASLLHRPKILFLDEPTIGLDIVIQKKVREFLRTYNHKFKTTVILTSHYMDDVKEVCKRVIMIDHGKKMYDGSLADLITTYANEKYLLVSFENEVKKKDLQKIGEVIEFDGIKAKIAVSRKDHAHKAAELLTSFEVDNLDIQEVDLEDIIMKFFTHRQ